MANVFDTIPTDPPAAPAAAPNVFDSVPAAKPNVFDNIPASDQPVSDPRIVVRDQPTGRQLRLSDVLNTDPGRVATGVAGQFQETLGPLAGAVSKLSRAIPADAMAAVASTPEYGGNIDAALTPAKRLQPGMTPTLSPGPGAQPAPQLPVDKAIDLAAEEDKSRGQFPWSSLAAKASQGVFGAAPKIAALPLAGETLPAQMLASGVLFSVDDNGQFHPSEVPFNALLPGVGKAARVATGAAIGAAISKGATSLENPIAQKVLEEIGDQTAMNALMVAQQSPQLVDLWKTDRNAFYQRMAETVGQNLAMRIGLGGVGDFNPDKNSQTRDFIDSNAELFTQRTLARVAGGDLARQLRTAPMEQPGPARQPIQDDTSTPAGFAAQTTTQPEKLSLSPAGGEQPAVNGEQVPPAGEQNGSIAPEPAPEAPKVPVNAPVTAGAVQEAEGLIDSSLKRGDISEGEALTMKAHIRVNAAKAEQAPGANLNQNDANSEAGNEIAEKSNSAGSQDLAEPTSSKPVKPPVPQYLLDEAQKTGAGGIVWDEKTLTWKLVAGSGKPAATGTSPLTEPAKGETKELAAPETETGGTATEVETPLRSTPAEKAAPLATGETIPVEGGGSPSRSAAVSRTRPFYTNQRPHDLIDEVEGRLGTIDPKLIREADPNWRPIGAARKVIKKGGEAADTAADALHESGLFKGNPEQVAELGEALNQAARARKGFRAGAARENKITRQDAAFARDVSRPGKNQRTIISDDLQPGDTLDIRGAPFKVRQFEFDEDGRVKSVTLDDGAKYGTQIVEGGTELNYDKGTLEQSTEPVVNRKTSEGTTKQRLAEEGENGEPRTRDAVVDFLDKAIEKTKPKTGLQTGEVSMGLAKIPVWLTQEAAHGALKVVRAAYLGGKKIAEAIQDGVAWLRSQNLKGFNEDEARAVLAKATEAIRPYSHLQEKAAEADEQLKQAVRVNGSPEAQRNAGKTRAEARAEMNLAGARYNKARADLVTHPDYIRDLLHEQDAVMRRLNPGPGVEKPTGDELTQLEERADKLQSELSEAPKKLVQKIADDLFFKGRPTVSETAAKTGMPELPASGGRATPAAEEAGKDMPADRAKRAVAELPTKARDFFSDIKNTRKKIGAKLATLPNRDIMSFTKGAADNRAMIAGKETSNFILHELNRAFGATGDRVGARNEMREHALTFVVESGRNPRMLDDFKDTIENSQHRYTAWAKRALNAIAYAKAHWDRFQPASEIYEKMNDAEVAEENNSGIATLHRSGGYVFHLQDVMHNWTMPEAGGGGGGAAAPFKHIREHNTYADAIANGVNPKTLNAVDLLQRRITLGRKLINYRGWVDSLQRLVDPSTQLPIVTDTILRTKADGTTDETAPPNYGIEHFAGQTVVVHKGYEGLFNALTGESWFNRGTVRPMTMEALAASKHLQLAFDTYHLGRMAFWNSMVRAATEGGPGMVLPGNPASYKRGLTLLDSTASDIRAMADRGEIPKEWANDLVDQKRRLRLLVDVGYNVGHSADNIYSHWIEKLPVAGQFNRWLFQKYVRGAMAESGLIELARQQKMNPQLSEAQVARQVARDLNKRFGNLNNESWIKSPTGKDLARMIILAPSWNEGLIRSEMGAVKQLAMAPVQSFKAGRLVIGTLGRATSTAVLGGFILNQVLNYITRGQPTWQNKEEGSTSKLSAYIPDVVGNSPGFFLNPLTLPMEMTDLMLKKTERTGDFTQALREAISGRLTTGAKAANVFWTRKDQNGANLKTGWDVGLEMGSSLVPFPLSGSAAVRAVKQLATGEPQEKFPGQFQRQAFQTVGAKLDSAPSDEQRIKSLATSFNREKGITPNAEFSHSDYYDLDRAILIGNQTEMQRALGDLLEKKTAQDIQKHYNTYARAPYTGKLSRENEFKTTLDPEQSQVYEQARQRRADVRDQVNQALRSQPARASADEP